MPNMGYRNRKSTTQTRRPQKRSLCTRFQCPLWVQLKSFRDKIVTGSFDTTAKLWDTNTGKLLYTFAGHQNEVVTVAFDPHKSLCATGSMDQTAKLWDL
jgi:WD40 repeat protein